MCVSTCTLDEVFQIWAHLRFKTGQVVHVLLSAKASVDHMSKHGSALMIAAEEGHSLCVQELIKGNANLDWADASGATAVMHASRMGHEPV